MAAFILSFLALSSVVQSQHIFPDCTNGPLKNNTICDTSASTRARAEALVSVLTLPEKINLTGNTSPGVPRLGLPAYQWWQEALHGVAESSGVSFASSGNYSYATSFPQPILMGAAFDDQLINDVASVVSTEARAFNNVNRSGLDYWTPNINPYKDPRWGRGQETPGEDPFHISSYVKNLINGLQGGYDPTIKKIVATCKHFAAYDLESWEGNYRYQFDTIVNTQELVEYYLPAFQTCARDANVGSVMCSYNALNGVPTCANSYLLQDILRDHWSWNNEDQYVTSDCDAIQNIFEPHNYASTREQAVADSLIAGTDLNCGTYYPTHLPTAYSEGLFNETVIDQAIVRLYSSLIKLGYFDPPSATPYRSLTFANVSTPSAKQLALKAAEEGIVLLKNDGTLPLRSTNVSVALIGSWANATDQMQGNYYGIAPYLHSPLYAAMEAGFEVHYATGVSGQGDPTTDAWQEALSASEEADVIVIADGIDTSIEAEGMDRYTIDWTGAQIDLAEQLAAMGKPTLLLQMGNQLDDTPFLKNPNISAIVWGGYPGQDGGTALTNILTGKVAPAGRLPVTQYPAAYVSEVPMTDMNLRPNATSGNPGRTYRWYNQSVIEFGYGLHYTNFSINANVSSNRYNISDLGCNSTLLDLCPFTTINAEITNAGSVTSDFVALAFVAGEYGPEPYPLKQLVAYERLHQVSAGASATAQLNLTLGNLARYDDDGNAIIFPGNYSLLLDVPTQTTIDFALVGDQLMLDEFPKRPSRG